METTRTITTAEELREAIRLLEQKKVAEQELLKEEFYYAKERLKPANVVRTTFNQVFTGPNFIRTALLTGAGITAGYVTKKYFQGLTGRILRRLLGKIV